jgi:hypothetical protein
MTPLDKAPWRVKIQDAAAKVFRQNILTAEDQVVLRLWHKTVSEGGPEALIAQPSVWADHALSGEWQGYRASSFSYRGRVIYYAISEPEKLIVVIRITVDHDYK